MPEVRTTSVVERSPEEVWAFVGDMDNWAPLLQGYEGHVKQDDRNSEWTLRGDLGMLSRVVHLTVQIHEWVEGERVGFTLTGLDEPLTGSGTFTLRGSGSPAPAPPPPPTGWLARMWAAVLGWFRPAPALPPPGPSRSELDLVLHIEIGGPMGPMVNAMLPPWLDGFTRQLADSIAERLRGDAA